MASPVCTASFMFDRRSGWGLCAMDGKAAPVAAAAAAKPAPPTVEQCKVLQQVIKQLEHTEEAKKMLPLAKMTPEMLQTTLQVQYAAAVGACPANVILAAPQHMSCASKFEAGWQQQQQQRSNNVSAVSGCVGQHQHSPAVLEALHCRSATAGCSPNDAGIWQCMYSYSWHHVLMPPVYLRLLSFCCTCVFQSCCPVLYPHVVLRCAVLVSAELSTTNQRQGRAHKAYAALGATGSSNLMAAIQGRCRKQRSSRRHSAAVAVRSRAARCAQSRACKDQPGDVCRQLDEVWGVWRDVPCLVLAAGLV